MTKIPHFYTAYDPAPDAGISFKESPSLTQQNMADDCDINNIMSRFEKTGIIDHIKDNPGQFGNFLDIPDYQTALNHVILAQNEFLALPSSVRDRFNNDPAKFLTFAQNPENQDDLIKMGLATARPIPEPTPSSPPSNPKASDDAGDKK